MSFSLRCSMQNHVVPSFFLTRTISAAHSLVEGLTCDQASLRFFLWREGMPDIITWLFVCCKSRILTFLWLVKKHKVVRTKLWLVTCVAVWLPGKEILRAIGVWWGERRERVFVSFKSFSWEYRSQSSQRWTNWMLSQNRMPCEIWRD